MSKDVVFVIMSGPDYESSVEGVVSGRREAIGVCEALNTECGESVYYVDEFLMGVVARAGDTEGEHLISGYSTWSEYDEAVKAAARYREGIAAREKEMRDIEFTREIVESFDKERAQVKAQEVEEMKLVLESSHLVMNERGATKARKRAVVSLKNATRERFNAKHSEIRDRELAAIEAALAERDAANIA